MKKYRVTNGTGHVIFTWARSARNAIFAYQTSYRGPHYNVTATEVEG